MKRLLLIALLSLSAVSAVGCGNGRSFLSRCRCFGSANRGAPCEAFAAPNAGVISPNPCAAPCCPPAVYSQTMPVYGGEVYGGCPACGDCGGFSGGGFPGMNLTPGTVIPGEGMIIDDGQQIPVLPGPATSPQTQLAPQPQPAPQPRPAPQSGSGTRNSGAAGGA